jgi:hypothetical protein
MSTQYAAATGALGCPVCGVTLRVGTAQGRTSHKPFLMLICPADGRHFRGFINDREYVAKVLARLEGQTPASGSEDDAKINPTGGRWPTLALKEVEGTDLDRGGAA